MEKPIRIFVEGIADIKFLKDYVSHIQGKELLKNDIVESDGWTNLISKKEKGEKILNLLTSNSDNDGVNLIIFDSDSNFEERKSEILKWKSENKLDFELFLFPNNKDNGALEDLLEKIINKNNIPIFECWEQFENCIKSKKIQDRTEPLTIPAKKTKIYGYLETLLGNSKSEKEKIKERERNYKNSKHWDLNSLDLIPLKEFLQNNIQ